MQGVLSLAHMERSMSTIVPSSSASIGLTVAQLLVLFIQKVYHLNFGGVMSGSTAVTAGLFGRPRRDGRSVRIISLSFDSLLSFLFGCKLSLRKQEILEKDEPTSLSKNL